MTRPKPTATRDRKNADRLATANAAYRQGDLATAHRLCQQILHLTPDHADTLNLLGLMTLDQGRADLAATLLESAVQSAPENADFRTTLGEIYRIAGNAERAEQCHRKAISLTPTLARAHHNLGILFHAQGKLEMAARSLDTASRLAPHDGALLIARAALLIDQNNPIAATTLLETIAASCRQDPIFHVTSGNARLMAGAFTAAASAYRTALALDPDLLEAEVNLARALRDGGDPASALTHLDHAQNMAPHLGIARWNAGLCHLLLGQYRAGWDGFRARFAAGAVAPSGIDGPIWQGEPLQGRTILVHGEQGHGDTIQFARFLPLLKRAGAGTVFCLVQPSLTALLTSIEGVDEWLCLDTPLPAVDLVTPLMDLAGWLCPDRTDFRDLLPPLSLPDAAGVAGLLTREKPTIGLVWRGNPAHANDQNRSIPLKELAPIFHQTGFTCYSLQQTMTADERTIAHDHLVDLGPHLTSWTKTAAIVAGLDRIICCDTSIAHLAGTLGRPVDLLLPFTPDWRWSLNRSDCDWYPTVRIHRQQQPGHWQSAIQSVTAGLVGP